MEGHLTWETGGPPDMGNWRRMLEGLKYKKPQSILRKAGVGEQRDEKISILKK